MRSAINKRIIIAEYFLCFFLLLLSCFFCKFAIASYVSICAAILFFFLIYKYNTILYLKYLSIFFGSVAIFVSVFIIEFKDVWLAELSIDSRFSGSLPEIVFSYCILIYVVLIGDVKYNKHIKKLKAASAANYKKSKIIPRYICILTAFVDAVFVVLWLYVIRTPSFLMHINRSVYNELYLQNMPIILKKLNGYSSFLFFFPVLCLFNKQKALGLTGIISYVMYCLWTGNKFGSFFWILCVFLIVLYPKLTSRKTKAIKKVFFFGGITVLVFVVIAIIIQSSFITTGNSKIEYAIFRIAAQGQLWWKTFIESHGRIHIAEFGDEINGILNGSIDVEPGASYGIYKIMYLCAPHTTVDNYIRNGSRFTEAGFAAAHYYLGFVGCTLYAVIMGIVVTILLNGIVNMLNEERYLRALILLRLYMIWRSSLSMFTFYDWIGKLSILSYFLLLISSKKPLVLRQGKREFLVL